MQYSSLCILCDIQNINVIMEGGAGGCEWISSQEGGGEISSTLNSRATWRHM